MRAFACNHCGQLLFFENSHCLRCGVLLGFIPDQLELRALEPVSGERFRLLESRERTRYKRCARAGEAACNWLVSEHEGELCASCRLTDAVPPMRSDLELRAFAQAETAKRRLLYQLRDLGLPYEGRGEDQSALRFTLAFSSEKQPVSTGHFRGLITLDLTECDNVHRERLRHQFGEPYRTLLGHFRHEVGHYYWDTMVDRRPSLARFRELFGDERRSYAEALKRYYDRPPAYWSNSHVSAYASSHPWEDWAETFAHYLHIRDTLQTAATFGLHVTPHAQAIPPLGGKLTARATEELAQQDFDAVVAEWLPLTYAFNQASRSMGKEDLYPFVLAPAVIEKLSFVHDLVRSSHTISLLDADESEKRESLASTASTASAA